MELRKSVIFCLFYLLSFTGCSSIDDDLSDCGTEAELTYELRLVTNISIELQTELTTQSELLLADALRSHLENIFTDFAHDVDLSFYDTEGDSVRLQHDQHIMNANQASYTLYLPMREYMHLATANIAENKVVSLASDERCHPARLQQVERDTIDSHTTGLFTARQKMEVLSGIDQTFHVRLFMANCASALVIDPRGHDYQDVKVYTTGFATGFNICDTTYIYGKSPIIRAQRVDDNGSGLLAYCSVSFPSRTPMRTVIETTEPFIAQEGDNALWEFHVYVTRSDGKVTETILSLKQPLLPGELKILNARMMDDGSVTTTASEVGVSVTLDWKPGGQHDIGL